MRNFSDDEYIKMFRKMVFWEWYTDVNTTKLFLHCLLMANWRPGRWKGIAYERGQFFTSLDNLAKETGLTIRQTRTALKHLEMTNEVTSQTTSRYTLITVVSFQKYQGERQAERQINDKQIDKQNDKQNDKQPTNKRQQNKNNKNNKNNKKKKEEYTAPPESEQNENCEDYEDDEEGFIIPQKDEHGNWINIPEEWKKVGGVVQIRC